MTLLPRHLALLLSAAALYLTALPAQAGVDVSIGINVAPPVYRAEPVPAPRHGYVWAPGYWRWHDHHHVWVPGRWVQARPGYVWVPERWERRGHHHHFVAGYWAREGRPHHHHGHR